MDKPQRFEIGQAVTPRNDKKWEKGDADATIPKIGEIYHVAEYVWDGREHEWFIVLVEIPDTRGPERGFDPVELNDAHIHELVEQSLTIEQPA